MKKIAAVLAIAGFAFAGQASATVNLVVNGGFETSPLSSKGWGVYSSIVGWNSTNGIEVQRDNVAGLAAEGHNLVELDAHSNSTIWQDIATVAGHTYKFSFAYSGRPGQSEETNGVGYSFGSINGEIWAAGQSQTVWTYQPFSNFVANTTGTTRLTFAGLGTSNSLGGYIDNVKVIDVTAPVPEPETYAMLGLGLLAVGVARRRKAI